MGDTEQIGALSYEALVSLNNVGALLLQRNRFEDAYLTYLDALHVLENGKTTEEEADGIDCSYRCSLRAMVSCATVRLHQEASSPPLPLAFRTGTGAAVVSSCQSGDSNRAVAPHTLLSPPSARVIRIVRQESIYLNYPCLQSSPLHYDLMSAVIIYNFGLCHMKLSIVNQSESDYFQQTGETLMKYAFSALPALPSFSNVEDMKSIITMSIITLSFLVDVGNLTAEEANWFRDNLRLASEGLSVFTADSTTAPAA